MELTDKEIEELMKEYYTDLITPNGHVKEVIGVDGNR